MRCFSRRLALCVAAFGGILHAQNAPTASQATESRANEIKGMPPRATPGDYAAHVPVGNVTLAAEFDGHNVPRPEGPLSTEDYVIVEACLFGPSGARLTLSPDNFSLKINDRKPQTSQSFLLVAHSLRDPEWVPPEQKKSKPKTSFGGGGGGEDTSTLPPKVPIELQRAWTQYVQRAALPEGDRALPEAGLLFFQYHGKSQSIHSLELVYSGPAGNATLPLQP
jgi:hypothetical protein